MLPSEHRRAPIGADALSSHERCAGASQENRHAGDLLRLRNASKRIGRFFGEGLRRGRGRSEQWGISWPGRKYVDEDIWSEFPRPRPGHRKDPTFRSTIDRTVLAAQISKLRGDIDDP